jgi:hypothetical protein
MTKLHASIYDNRGRRQSPILAPASFIQYQYVIVFPELTPAECTTYLSLARKVSLIKQLSLELSLNVESQSGMLAAM